MKKIERRSACPVSFALDFFGDKWTFLVLRDMIFHGKRYYKEFLAADEGIATNILSDRLKRLESIGVIHSMKDPSKKTQKVYSLTSKGKDLIPILVDMIAWSAKHEEGLNVTQAFLDRVKNDREQLLDDIMGSLEQRS
ncbi:helix-turn-helix domain-containing protein [Pontibacter sp. G13]|uniref:winged helix-turn-helix transcriptional regulator n=1 Tax=Pontibacter sp. G13 TaxID=3074898 RepID=UPI00288BB4DE|nr:helix-turn-helix domain-containing protein [Pontibacter sp. G13]WNJ19820.1 helix-turn-helix domain-containing protein [Pontibacter sp. G13]